MGLDMIRSGMFFLLFFFQSNMVRCVLEPMDIYDYLAPLVLRNGCVSDVQPPSQRVGIIRPDARVGLRTSSKGPQQISMLLPRR